MVGPSSPRVWPGLDEAVLDGTRRAGAPYQRREGVRGRDPELALTPPRIGHGSRRVYPHYFGALVRAFRCSTRGSLPPTRGSLIVRCPPRLEPVLPGHGRHRELAARLRAGAPQPRPRRRGAHWSPPKRPRADRCVRRHPGVPRSDLERPRGTRHAVACTGASGGSSRSSEERARTSSTCNYVGPNLWAHVRIPDRAPTLTTIHASLPALLDPASVPVALRLLGTVSGCHASPGWHSRRSGPSHPRSPTARRSCPMVWSSRPIRPSPRRSSLDPVPWPPRRPEGRRRRGLGDATGDRPGAGDDARHRRRRM